MAGRHREQRTTVDMVPGALRRGTKATAAAIGDRYTWRPRELNETGKIEWVYKPGVRHGAHDATPTIAEIAATEPCEKTTGWPATSCATRLRITSDDWETGYCLPCRIRAALDRQEHRPIPDPFKPWPASAQDVLLDWIVENTSSRDPYNPELLIDFEGHPQVPGVGRMVYRVRWIEMQPWAHRTRVENIPKVVAAKANYIATGERL